jgi:predicted DCC family thiol-disulfide oxidoreductase YuxK
MMQANPSGFPLAYAVRTHTFPAMGWILFFDGDCAFCSCSVRTVARLDKRGNISFAPLQGELAREMGFSHHAAKEGGTMVLLREADGEVRTQSDAWIELVRALGGGWRVFAIAGIIPKRLRDFVYRFIAKHRYQLMGKADHCALADAVLTARFRK